MVRWVVVVGVVAGLGGCKKDDGDGDLARPANPTCVAPERVSGVGRFQFEPHFEGYGFSDPVTLTWSEGAPGWWYVVEQDGRILRFAQDETGSPEVVLDIRSQVVRGSELGLLGMAFHPDFASNGEIYVNYTNDAAGLETRIARFTSPDGGASFGSETILFTVDQPFTNHNAGHLAFGPDGYLYFGLGDGGSGGDPLGNGQNVDSPLGKMLRIDVDGGDPYAIPADNPFAQGGGLPEIYAWGLRNPWRFSFDSATGELWVGDVGQNATEEVDRVERGGNYGWNITEGKACFEPPSGCNKAGLIAPEATYPNPGGASVIGGIVYRGSAIPELVGTYLYNDFYSDAVYTLVGGKSDEAATAPGAIVHWEEGPDGEAWVLTYGGRIYTLAPKGQGATGGPPALLSQTGCFEAGNPSQAVDGAVAFDVAHPFWSDEADKRRWLAIPDGTTIQAQPDGDWEFPVGTVLLKEFSRGGARIETRLLARHDDGGWAGYAYRWRDDGSEADLLPAGIQVDADGPWTIPDRSSCLLCHTEAAGGSLGPETAQLGEQAQELARMGMLLGVDPEAAAPETWPAVGDGSASVEDRARTWLQVNCSSCHRPDGGSRTDWDFRKTASLAELGVCADPGKGDLGVAGAQVIAPGDPDSSVVWLRMSRRDAYQMPPLGSHMVDEVASGVLREWIEGLSGCP